MLEASFGGNILRDLGQFAAAQRVQQIAGEDDALAASLDQSLFGEEIDPLLQCVLDLTTKAQATQP